MEEQIKLKNLKIKHEWFKMDETTAQKLTEEIKKRISAEKNVDDLEKLLQKEKKKFKILAESKSREIVETLEKLEKS